MAKIRSEVSENLKWKLTDIFSSDEEFKALLKDVEGRLNFAQYEGKLSDVDIHEGLALERNIQSIEVDALAAMTGI